MITSTETHAEMSRLCESFPTLRGVPGVRLWDQHKFAKWASGPAPSYAMRQAAAFVLAVWNGCTPNDEEGGWWNGAPYSVGRFDAVEAMKCWDTHHQVAFLDWVHNPFWP